MKKLLLAILVLVLITSACAPTPTATPEPEEQMPVEEPTPTEEPAPPEEQELTKLVISFGGICICHAPVPVGVELGIFEKYGLEIEMFQVASGFEAHAAVLTGDAHVADSVVAVAASAAQQGVEATALFMANGSPAGTFETDKYFAIVASEESGIREGHVEDLKGKKVGAPKGTIGHQYLYYTLLNNGLDPDNDIELVNVSPPDLPSALQAGSIDALSVWEPLALLALDSIENSVEVSRGGAAIQFLFQRWMSPEFVEDNPEIVKAFILGYAEAAQYIRQNPEEALAILEGVLPDLDKEILAEALSYLTFDMRFSKESQEAVEQGLEFARLTGGLEGEYDFYAHFDSSYLNEVMEEHPEFWSDLPPIPPELELQSSNCCDFAYSGK